MSGEDDSDEGADEAHRTANTARATAEAFLLQSQAFALALAQLNAVSGQQTGLTSAQIMMATAFLRILRS